MQKSGLTLLLTAIFSLTLLGNVYAETTASTNPTLQTPAESNANAAAANAATDQDANQTKDDDNTAKNEEAIPDTATGDDY